MFLFVFQLKELQRVGLTRGRKRWSVLVNQSVNESEMAHYCRCRMLCFWKQQSQVSKAFLWKQKTIANRNQLFKLFEELLPTKRSSHVNKNRKSFGYRYTRCAISWIRFVLKAAFRTSKLSTVSKLMNESAILLFTEDSLRTKSVLTVLSPSFETLKKIELSLSVAVN